MSKSMWVAFDGVDVVILIVMILSFGWGYFIGTVEKPVRPEMGNCYDLPQLHFPAM
jgi:hypothetical protein